VYSPGGILYSGKYPPGLSFLIRTHLLLGQCQEQRLRTELMGVIRWVGASYNGVVSIDYQRKMAGCLPFSPTALTLLPADNGPLLMGKTVRRSSDNESGNEKGAVLLDEKA
jgi:hypothetical protein